MEAFGRHLLLEMWDCKREFLNDGDRIMEFLNTAATDAGATVVKQFYHEFNPPGITGVAILAESHIAIHTWPIEGYVAIDIFTCGTQANPELAIERLVQSFGPKDYTSIELKRGSPHIKDTILFKSHSGVAGGVC